MKASTISALEWATNSRFSFRRADVLVDEFGRAGEHLRARTPGREPVNLALEYAILNAFPGSHKRVANLGALRDRSDGRRAKGSP